MDFTNQIGITNDQVYTNRRDINNLMELLGNFKQRITQIEEERLSPLGVTFVPNPMTTSLDGGTFTIFNVSGLTITGTSDLQGPLNVGGTAAFSTNVHITGDAITTGSLTVGNNANVAGTFSVTGATTLNDTLLVIGASTCGSTLTVSGATTLSSTLSVAAEGTFLSNLNVNGNAVVTGSLGVSGLGTFSNNLTVSGATALGGALTVSGATTLSNTLDISGITIINNNTPSTSTSTGALVVAGGVGIGADLHSGDIFSSGTVRVAGVLTVIGLSNLHGPLVLGANAVIGTTLTVGGITEINSNTTSTNSTNGALVVTGGVGIGENLNVGGMLNVTGSISKGSGTFKIDHPLEEKKDTHYLVHSFVESPQANNIYRGKVKLENGKAIINLDEVSTMTKGTFIVLNRDIHIYTTNETDWDSVRGRVEGNLLIIECQNTQSNATISWLVIGERQDTHMYESPITGNNGKVIVEPLK